jgi:hypothetical protein
MKSKIIVILRIFIGFVITLGVGIFSYTSLRHYMLQRVSEEQTNVNIGYIGFGVFIVCVCCIVYFMSSRKLRSLTTEEYEALQGSNLIHYSSHLSDGGHDGVVMLNATRVDLPNGNMPIVWFHLSNGPDLSEPRFRSYWSNHYTVHKPNTKTIIALSEIPANRVFIRPHDQSIAVLGDVVAAGVIQKDFSWYNDRLYLLPTIRYSIVSFLSVIVIVSFALSDIWNFLFKRKKSIS